MEATANPLWPAEMQTAKSVVKNTSNSCFIGDFFCPDLTALGSALPTTWAAKPRYTIKSIYPKVMEGISSRSAY